MNKNCEMIRDLLPLYADDVCSDESRKAVEEHIKECANCKAELEKLGKSITVSPQKDGEVLKHIKRRLRIEKLVVGLICAAVLIAAMFGTLIHLNNSLKTMDYDRYNISENVYVTELDGSLLLCVKGGAASFDSLVPTISDTNGKHLLHDEDFDKSKKNGKGFTLKQRRIASFSFVDFGNEYPFAYQIGRIDELKEKNIEKIFYYDDVNDKEYILWESGQND